MIKSLLAANKSERDRFAIPRSVQQSIPIRCVYSDGIWHVGRKHSRTWRFADINYAAASEEERRSIFLSYCAVLNSLPTDAAAKITIINHRINPVDFQRQILMKERGDELDRYRRESNQILTQTGRRKQQSGPGESTSPSLSRSGKSRRPGPISGGWTPICQRALDGWTPGPAPHHP